MSHLADSTFIKAFGTDKPATDIDVHADAMRYANFDPNGDHAMDVPVPQDTYAVVHACIPVTWDVQRFISAINKHVRRTIGSEIFYDSQSAADVANMEEGAAPVNFTNLEVTFRKG